MSKTIIKNNNINAKNAINRYLYKSSDNFAIQVDGPWGTGKTYFIKHVIFNMIKNRNNKIQHKDKMKEKSNNYLIPIYISLSGIKNLRNLKVDLVNSLLLYLSGHNENSNASKFLLTIFGKGIDVVLSNNKHIKPYMKLLKSFGIDLDSVSFIKKLNNIISNTNERIVFVFDDLERTDLGIKSFFGFLSNIIDNFKCKIIIISNIDKYRIMDSQQYDLYVNYKEKVISRTIHFGNDSQNVANNLLIYYINYNKNNILSQKWIINASNIMVRRLNDINLRTIINIIYTFNDFSNEVGASIRNHHLGKDLQKQSLKTGYLSIFTLTDMIKRGLHIDFHSIYNKRFNGVNVGIKSSIKQYKNILSYRKNSKLSIKNIKGCIFSLKYLLIKFFDNVLGSNLKEFNYIFIDNILYTYDIYNLIKNDEFNVSHYIHIIHEMFHNSDIRLNHLFTCFITNYKNISYKNLLHYESVFINSLGDLNNISVENLLIIYSVFYNFKLLGIYNDETYLKKMKNIIKIKAQDISTNDINEFLPMSKLKDGKLKRFLTRIYDKSYNNPLRNEQRHLNMIIDGEIYNTPIDSTKWFDNKSLFKTILVSDSLRHKLLNPSYPIRLRRLINYIKSVLEDSSYKNHIKELDNYPKFSELVQRSIKNTTDPIIKINLKDLKTEIERYKKDLNNQKNGKSLQLFNN